MDLKQEQINENENSETADFVSFGIFSYQSISELNRIKPKYNSIKEEILQILTSDEFNQTFRKANMFLEDFASHKYTTKSDGVLKDKIFNIDISWKQGEQMTFEEVFPIMIYVEFDAIKNIFKNYTRQQLISFFHLCRQLLIISNKFGEQASDKEFFVAVNNQNNELISTNKMEIVRLYGPLSATTSLTVAKFLATEKGMILTIKPTCCHVFNASFIKYFSEEELWIIGLMHLRIVDTKICHDVQKDDPKSLSVNPL